MRSSQTLALRRARVVLVVGALLGGVSFLWPFIVAPGRFSDSSFAPLMFAGLLVVVLAVVATQIAEGGIDAKVIAMLGVLSAVSIVLRPLGAGTAGIETLFFLIVLAGRVFGAGFGFVLGCTAIVASALTTGGVGPWMPYQMFATAIIGLGAGLLPGWRGRAELALLCAYCALGSFAYGLALNLSFWPFALGTRSGAAYVPGGSIGTNVVHYLVFDATTSLGWDTGRAITNVLAVLVLGPALLSVLRRACKKAAFDAEVRFAEPADQTASSSRSGAPKRSSVRP